MRISKMKSLALVALAASTAMATPAGATLVLSYSTDGGATIIPIPGGNDTLTPGKASVTSFVVGNYTIDLSGNGAPFLSSPNLLSQTLSVSSGGAGTLTLFVADTNLATFNGSLTSSFTSNTMTALSATISSYYSLANASNTGTLLESKTFTGLGTFAQADAVNAVSPWSTTARYDITFGAGGGFFNGNANLTGAVPEPATWMMMLLGFGAIGFGLRSRRSVKTKVSFA